MAVPFTYMLSGAMNPKPNVTQCAQEKSNLNLGHYHNKPVPFGLIIAET